MLAFRRRQHLLQPKKIGLFHTRSLATLLLLGKAQSGDVYVFHAPPQKSHLTKVSKGAGRRVPAVKVECRLWVQKADDRRNAPQRARRAECGHLRTLGRTGRVHSKLTYFWSAIAHRARFDRPVACLSSLHKRLVQATASPASVGADSVFADPRAWAPESPRCLVRDRLFRDRGSTGLSEGVDRVRTAAAPHYAALAGRVAPAWGRSDHRLK